MGHGTTGGEGIVTLSDIESAEIDWWIVDIVATERAEAVKRLTGTTTDAKIGDILGITANNVQSIRKKGRLAP